MCPEEMLKSSNDQLRPAVFRLSTATRISPSPVDAGSPQASTCARLFFCGACLFLVSVLISADILSNQTRPALEGEIDPEPAHGDQEAIVEADQQIDMRDAPEKPGDKALELGTVPVDDR